MKHFATFIGAIAILNALASLVLPGWAADYENGNRNREWDVAFQADPGGPADLRFEGPDVGDVGAPIIVRLMGIDLDATKTLAEIFAEIRKVRIEVNAPKDATATFSSELKIDPIKGELRLDLAIVADKPGVYLLSALWVEGEAVGFTQHRLTLGQMPQPPPVVVPPPVDPITPPPVTTVTAVTFIYEKDTTAIPSGVLVALDKLNRATPPILATTFEQDTTTGDGKVPEQYAVALAAAKATGLPCLVVLSGDKVVRTVKGVTTEAQVIEAAK